MKGEDTCDFCKKELRKDKYKFKMRIQLKGGYHNGTLASPNRDSCLSCLKKKFGDTLLEDINSLILRCNQIRRTNKKLLSVGEE